MNRNTYKPVFLTGFLALAALLGAFLISRASVAQETPRPTAVVQSAQKWEYTIVRLEGPSKNLDASIAALNRFGAEGWEAVELLPPSYDILLKRPAGR